MDPAEPREKLLASALRLLLPFGIAGLAALTLWVVGASIWIIAPPERLDALKAEALRAAAGGAAALIASVAFAVRRRFRMAWAAILAGFVWVFTALN